MRRTDFESRISSRDLILAIVAAMEQAAISGLCREGQLEIGVQAGRRVRPDLPDEELLQVADAVQGLPLDEL